MRRKPSQFPTGLSKRSASVQLLRLFFPASLEPRRRSPRVSKRTFEKPHQSRNRLRAKAVRLAFERIGRPEMSGAGDDDAAHKKPGLGKGRQERAGLRRRIDDVVLGAV